MYVMMQLFFCLFLSQVALGQEPIAGTVVKVIDGDSLQIQTNSKKIETRLYGIDSPEYNQRFSKAAKKFVRNQVQDKNVTVYPDYYDSYGRLVAIVTYGGKVLNQELIVSGYAWVYPRYCKKEICKRWKKDEKMARETNKGLWSEKKPVPPWRWKRMKRQ